MAIHFLNMLIYSFQSKNNTDLVFYLPDLTLDYMQYFIPFIKNKTEKFIRVLFHL